MELVDLLSWWFKVSIARRVVLNRTRLGKYHRTTVPEEVRKLLNLHEGDEVVWIFEDGRIVVEKVVEGRGLVHEG